MFSKALAIEDGSESTIIIKSDESKEKVKSSVESADISSDESSDEGNDESSDESSDEGNDESSDEGNDESTKDVSTVDATDNFKDQQVQSTANSPELQCEKGIEYWALAIKFLAKEQGITISDAYKQFAKYFIAAMPDPSNSQESKTAVGLMECLKEKAIALLAIEDSQPTREDTSLQHQKNTSQIKQDSQQPSTPLQTLVTEKQMQQQQYDTSQLLPLPIQPNQQNEPQVTEEQEADESQQDNIDLSIITQEEMQKAQYEKFKNIIEKVKQKYHEIEILK